MRIYDGDNNTVLEFEGYLNNLNLEMNYTDVNDNCNITAEFNITHWIEQSNSFEGKQLYIDISHNDITFIVWIQDRRISIVGGHLEFIDSRNIQGPNRYILNITGRVLRRIQNNSGQEYTNAPYGSVSSNGEQVLEAMERIERATQERLLNNAIQQAQIQRNMILMENEHLIREQLEEPMPSNKEAFLKEYPEELEPSEEEDETINGYNIIIIEGD